MNIGVIAAMDKELVRLQALMPDACEIAPGIYRGTIGGNTVVMCGSGIGKVNAALAAQRLIATCSPDCVISTGVAGGLNSALEPKDVVASTEVVYHDVWCGEPNEWGQVQGLPSRYKADEAILAKINVRKGLFTSGDQFITEEPREREILARFPDALTVDMESAAIAQTCFVNAVPFVCIRVVSDVCGKDRESQYANFWAEVADNSFETIKQIISKI